MNPMSRWESEARVDAPWCIVNIVNKGYIHQAVGPGKNGMEDQWSLDGEHGSSQRGGILYYTQQDIPGSAVDIGSGNLVGNSQRFPC